MSTDGMTRKERTAKYDLVGIGRNGELRCDLRRQRVNKYRRMAHAAEWWGDRDRAEYWRRIADKVSSMYVTLRGSNS